MSDTTILFVTTVYRVETGLVWMEDRGDYVPGYLVVNLETEVAEAERTNLPEAIFLCKMLTQRLAEELGTTPAQEALPLKAAPTPAKKDA